MPAVQSQKSGSAVVPLMEAARVIESVAHYEAHRPDDVPDLTQVALFAYHKVEERYRAQQVVVDKPWALVRTTAQRAMRAYYYQQREWQGRGEMNKALDVDDAINTGHALAFVAGLDGRARGGEQAELLEFRDYFTALERTCGRAARIVVEQLLMPSGDTAARILGEVGQKQAAQARARKYGQQARQPRGVKKQVRISHRLVRDALGLTPAQWVREMAGIKQFTRAWLAGQQ